MTRRREDRFLVDDAVSAIRQRPSARPRIATDKADRRRLIAERAPRVRVHRALFDAHWKVLHARRI